MDKGRGGRGASRVGTGAEGATSTEGASPARSGRRRRLGRGVCARVGGPAEVAAGAAAAASPKVTLSRAAGRRTAGGRCGRPVRVRARGAGEGGGGAASADSRRAGPRPVSGSRPPSRRARFGAGGASRPQRAWGVGRPRLPGRRAPSAPAPASRVAPVTDVGSLGATRCQQVTNDGSEATWGSLSLVGGRAGAPSPTTGGLRPASATTRPPHTGSDPLERAGAHGRAPTVPRPSGAGPPTGPEESRLRPDVPTTTTDLGSVSRHWRRPSRLHYKGDRGSVW